MPDRAMWEIRPAKAPWTSTTGDVEIARYWARRSGVTVTPDPFATPTPLEEPMAVLDSELPDAVRTWEVTPGNTDWLAAFDRGTAARHELDGEPFHQPDECQRVAGRPCEFHRGWLAGFEAGQRDALAYGRDAA